MNSNDAEVNLDIPSELAMAQLGNKLAQFEADHLLIFLQGPLGAGKTTLARGFLQGLGYTGKVKSPTYALVEPYELEYAQEDKKNKKVFHFDFYRVQEPSELIEMGIQEYFSYAAYFLIEWAENVCNFLPTPDVICKIELNDNTRKVSFKANSVIGTSLLTKIFPHNF